MFELHQSKQTEEKMCDIYKKEKKNVLYLSKTKRKNTSY